MVDVTTWLSLGAVGMGLGTLVLAYGFRLVPRTNRRRYAIVVAVPLIAFFAYLLMALGFGGIETQEGESILVLRYLDWLLTTPLHVLYLGLLAGAAKKLLVRSLSLMAATILFGFAGAMLAPPLKWLLFAAGFLTFAGVMYDSFYGFDTAAQEKPDTILAVFRKLRSFVIVLWLIYPVIWLLAPIGVGLMNLNTTVLVISYIDVVAKVGFGLIALSAQLSFGQSTDAPVAAE